MSHLCVIPFSGFYNSLHDSSLDDALNDMFSDRDTGTQINQGLALAAWDRTDWRQVHTDYAREYCENFAHEFKLDLTFDELNCPKEYNFPPGDRIFAYITTESLQKVFDAVDTPALRLKVRANHTTRDGFISFYSNVLEEWGDFRTWDHNQIATLLEVFVDLESQDEFDQYAEHSLMEDSRGNGFLDSILFANCLAMKRLCRIHKYLEVRRAR